MNLARITFRSLVCVNIGTLFLSLVSPKFNELMRGAGLFHFAGWMWMACLFATPLYIVTAIWMAKRQKTSFVPLTIDSVLAIAWVGFFCGTIFSAWLRLFTAI
jgi:hypothetical protein